MPIPAAFDLSGRVAVKVTRAGGPDEHRFRYRQAARRTRCRRSDQRHHGPDPGQGQRTARRWFSRGRDHRRSAAVGVASRLVAKLRWSSSVKPDIVVNNSQNSLISAADPVFESGTVEAIQTGDLAGCARPQP